MRWLVEKIEHTILKNLIFNGEYSKRVFPFIIEEYFSDNSDKVLFTEIHKFIDKYKELPSIESLVIDLHNNTKINSQTLSECVSILNKIKSDEESPNIDWLIDSTEKFCQDKAVYNAIMDSVNILEGTSKNNKGEIPKLLSDALSISFDSHVGHDYMDDHMDRFLSYNKDEMKIKFDLDYFNLITKNGVLLKTLNMVLAGPGVGKTLFLCHFAASFLLQGYDVLYITLEMAEERIAERIDANILNWPVHNLKNLSSDEWESKFKRLTKKTKGKLIIKEYPTASASVLHFRALLNELKLKKNFKPQVIFIDYLNICCSSRMSMGSGSYSYIKAIAEELRGLAVEENVPLFSATQINRAGYGSSDPGMEDTSESFGLPATCDFMFAIVTNEELEKMNQVMVKQLKNRYNDINLYKRFVVGIDRSKMKLYNTEGTSQDDIMNESSPKVKSPFDVENDKLKLNREKFKGLKV